MIEKCLIHNLKLEVVVEKRFKAVNLKKVHPLMSKIYKTHNLRLCEELYTLGVKVFREMITALTQGYITQIGGRYNNIRVRYTPISEKQKQCKIRFFEKQKANITNLTPPNSFFLRLKTRSSTKYYELIFFGKLFDNYINNVNNDTFTLKLLTYKDILKRVIERYKFKYKERNLRKGFSFFIKTLRFATYYNNYVKIFYQRKRLSGVFIKCFNKPEKPYWEYLERVSSKYTSKFYIHIFNNNFSMLKEGNWKKIFRTKPFFKRPDAALYEIKNHVPISKKIIHWDNRKIDINQLKLA